MNPLKTAARKLVFPLIVGAGAEKIWRWNITPRILNVMYHGVVRANGNYFSPRHITSEQFERHLQYYIREFNIISLRDAFEMHRQGIVPDRDTISLSFDDGYLNNLEVALPLLEKYNVPCTFFITGFSIEQRDPPIIWADVISCYHLLHPDTPVTFGSRTFERLIDTQNGQHIFDFIKHCTPELRDAYIGQLYTDFNLHKEFEALPPELWELMGASGVKQLASSPIAEIGAHGNMHYNLGNISPEQARTDLLSCRNQLSLLLGPEIDMIAYPDGNYSDTVKDIAESVGFTMQLAVRYLLQGDSSDKRILNRHILSSTTTYASNMFYLNQAFRKQGF